MNPLESLVDLPVTAIEDDRGTLTIRFSEATTLAIYNKNSLSTNIDAFVGRRVLTINESPDRIFVFFDGGPYVTIGMTDDDFVGPEAMLLERIGEPPIVWN